MDVVFVIIDAIATFIMFVTVLVPCVVVVVLVSVVAVFIFALILWSCSILFFALLRRAALEPQRPVRKASSCPCPAGPYNDTTCLILLVSLLL